MLRFTEEDRTNLLKRVIEIGETDNRVTGGALIGSVATETFDAWSDIDITFGINSENEPKLVLEEWTALLQEEYSVVHHFDLIHLSTIYRVFLFSNGLELDLSVTPENDFGPRASGFKLLFGKANEMQVASPPLPEAFIGLCWHHIMHTNTAINRGKKWHAEFWISSLRNHLIARKCSRLELVSSFAKGADALPQQEVDVFQDTLVVSLETDEMRRALQAIVVIFLSEVKLVNKELAEQFEKVFSISLTR
jgi:predicted nucleotidyltransferase